MSTKNKKVITKLIARHGQFSPYEIADYHMQFPHYVRLTDSDILRKHLGEDIDEFSAFIFSTEPITENRIDQVLEAELLEILGEYGQPLNSTGEPIDVSSLPN